MKVSDSPLDSFVIIRPRVTEVAVTVNFAAVRFKPRI